MQAIPAAPRVDEALRAVYRQPEFAERTPEFSLMGWMAEQFGRFLHWLSEKFGFLQGLENGSPFFFWLAVVVLSVTAAALLGHLVLSVTRGVASSSAARGTSAGPATGHGPRSAAEWEEIARRAAGEGRLRDAALALYLALVLRLDARGAVRFDSAKTPGDYRREVRAHPDAARPFAAFLRGFEPVAFGGRALDRDGYERLRAAAGEAGVHG